MNIFGGKKSAKDKKTCDAVTPTSSARAKMEELFENQLKEAQVASANAMKMVEVEIFCNKSINKFIDMVQEDILQLFKTNRLSEKDINTYLIKTIIAKIAGKLLDSPHHTIYIPTISDKIAEAIIEFCVFSR